jgi:uncharacterized membrane protein
MARHDGSPREGAGNATLVTLGIAAAAGAAGAALWYGTRQGEDRPADDAPGRSARQRRFGDYAVAHRTVTIGRPRAGLFAFWRDFSNLPRFMQNVRAVEDTGADTLRWTIDGPAGRPVRIETRIVEERDGELIAWRSVEGSEIETEGKVSFRDAPADRGTEVTAIVAYKPPFGELGRFVATAFQKEPAVQGRRELKRFKMLMETGEVATSRNRKH